MIMRRWRGAIRPEDAEEYLRHQADTGVGDYRRTPGNLGVVVLSRRVGDVVEVVDLSLWESLDAVRAFAGDDPSVARFYPGDDDLLVERDGHADHWEVVEADLDPRLATRGG